MRLRLRSVILTAFTVGLVGILSGCPSTPAGPTCPGVDCPPADAGLPTRVCANLKRIGCDEGLKTTCEQSVVTGLNLGYPVTCWETAADKSVARGCGQLKCP
jgi:hypothetical protein